MKLPNSSEMKALDKAAIEDYGIPGMVLMENAGLGTVNMMEKELGPPKGCFSIILIGPGNNGGDGLVIGRHLHQRGCEPIFFFLISPDKLTGDAALNMKIIRKLRLPFHLIDNKTRVKTVPVLFKQIESRGKPCYAIIDSIFGIGISKDISGHYGDVIDLFNRPDFAHNVPVVSADVPSGMNPDTGRVFGKCIKANHTATYGCPKAGLVIHGSTNLRGKLHVIDIGIPPEAINQINISTEHLNEEYGQSLLQPLKRKVASHKGSHGHLLLLAGSSGKTGAALLAARGAVRSGAGLVTLCSPYDLNTIYETSFPEIMTSILPTSSSLINISDLSHITKQIEGKKCVVLGPGIGTDPRTAELVLYLYHTLPIPLIIDADAITILARNKNQRKEPAGPRIFTPHPGELARVLGCSAEEIEDNRLESARQGCSVFSNNYQQTILVLKGAGTLITSNEGNIIINTTGNPGMATGGMGDVLSGMIGSFICQGLSILNATSGAVFLHGYTGDRLYEETGQGFTASELADTIPLCLKSFIN